MSVRRSAAARCTPCEACGDGPFVPVWAFVALAAHPLRHFGTFERVRPNVTCNGLPATKMDPPAGETISGTPGRDVINGLGGKDVLRGLVGKDIHCGGRGNDRMFGGPGDDRLLGRDGIDRLKVELGFDQCDLDDAPSASAIACERVSVAPPPSPCCEDVAWASVS